MRRESGVEMGVVSKHPDPYSGGYSAGGAIENRAPRNSSLQVAYQDLKQRMTNTKLAEDSRRVTRKTKGLDPNVPKQQEFKLPPKDERQKNAQNADEKASKIQKMDEHKITLEELCMRFGTNVESGLETSAAIKRNLQEGDNKLPEKKKTPAWIKFLIEISNWFSIMLWVGSILCIVTYAIQPSGNLPNLYLGFILIFVILLTGAITYMQGAKSEALMEGFKNMLPSASKVIRDGKMTNIEAQKLVRGDVVEIKSGDKVPADIRIIVSNQMKVDNSALTGEVQPLLRSPQCTNPDEPFETKNLAFFGTLCKQGMGRGIVIGIGQNTVLGQIADLAASGGQQKSPLRVELDRFVLLITIIALVLGVVFFFLAYFVVGYNLLQCMIFGIGILVANVPEGLLGCITISLAITAQKLAEKQVLVKNLEAVETLGSTSCICSDKTGTLTQNKMTVENLWYDGEVRKADNKEHKGPSFEYQYEVDDPSFKCLHECAMICSEAKFNVTEEQMKTPGFKYTLAPVIGDASETALVKFYQPIEQISITRAKYKMAKCKDDSPAKMPFNSTNKYALSIVNQETSDSYYCVYIKGAPEKIWKFCGRILNEGRFKEIDEEENKKFDRVNLQFGKNGERVLGFAKLHLNKEKFPKDFPFNTSSPDNFNFPMEDFVFVGLLSLMDPPKETVPFAVKKCKSAGIKVIMVTGDQPPTAAAIAKQVNIISLKTNEDYKEEGYTAAEALEKARAIVIHGDMIAKAFEESEEEGGKTLLSWVKKPQVVFARTTPAQKLLIVKACQESGSIVGVTGDGVNDSPAIKQADIGISMGISGSDVTKDAADMVLLNDDFASIVDGIEQGRKIFDNLKKTVVYLLTSNMTEIWPFLALILIQIPLPLSNIFMLCICVGTDIYPAISLAYEESEFDIMTRKPRKIDDHLVSGKLLCHAYGQMGEIATAAGFFCYFVIMQVYGYSPTTLFGLLSKNAYNPNNDINYNGQYAYDPNAFFFGQPYTYTNCTQYTPIQNYPNWLSTANGNIDLRQVFLTCNPTTGQFYQSVTWPATCHSSHSPVTNGPVCFTTEALFYAQSGYFATVVMVQWSNIFACKSRKASLFYSALNRHMMWGVLTETILFIFLLYTPGVNGVFGGRPLNFFLLFPGLLFSIVLLVWEEVRKFLINRKSNGIYPNWFERHLLW